MSVQGGDSFDHLTAAQLGRKWDYVGTDITGVDVLYGRFGSVGLRGKGIFETIGQGMLGKNLGKFYTGWGFFGSAVRHETMQAQGYTVLHSVYDIASSGGMKLCTLLGADGSLNIGYITVNNFSTIVNILASTAPGQFAAGAHVYFESGFKINLTTGGAICKIAGQGPGDPGYVEYVGNTVRSTGSNYHPDSSTEQFSHVRLGGNADTVGSGASTDWDDIYWCDDVDDGKLPSTATFLGDVRLGILKPNGVGATSDFTPTAGDNYTNVDDTAPDDLTSYVSASAVDDMDLYEMENVPIGTVSIFALLFNVDGSTTGAVTKQYSTLARPALSGVATVVDTRTAPQGFINQQDVSQANPDTTERWDPAEVNTMQAGYIIEL